MSACWYRVRFYFFMPSYDANECLNIAPYLCNITTTWAPLIGTSSTNQSIGAVTMIKDRQRSRPYDIGRYMVY